MRIIDAEQGTEEWLRARIGCPSGSGFSKLITSAGKPSTTRDTYVNQLIAEKVIGEIPETYSNEWMERGKVLEPEARAFYEFEREVVVEETGLLSMTLMNLVCRLMDWLVWTVDWKLNVLLQRRTLNTFDRASYLRNTKHK